MGRLRHPRFQAMVDDVGGMMSASVYATIYERVRTLPVAGGVIEIGPYRGASTIAMAWGLQDSGRAVAGPVVTVEKADGGQWEEPGKTHEDNISVLRANLERHRVAELVTVFPERASDENSSEVIALLGDAPLAVLSHDADGHIDRDFRLFWPLLEPGGLIVVDDYRETTAKFQRPDERRPQGGIKGPLTWRLLNQFIEWGLFTPLETVGETTFGLKPEGADFSRFDEAVCDEIYRGVIRDRDAYLDAKGL